MKGITLFITTALLLCSIILTLAIANIRIRNKIRKTYLWSDNRHIGPISIPWHVYGIKKDRLFHQYGLIKMIDEECLLYLVTDIRVEIGIISRLCGIGDIVISTRDENERKILLCGVKDVYYVRDIISEHVDIAKNNRNEIIIR